ncbi:MAG: saccharopine dehydrogenase family protein [Vulcanimicrobiota bacterium]
MDKRKVLSLGAGAMGAAAAQTAASFSEIESLIVADLNLDASQKVASVCGAKAKAAAINVTDRKALVSLMREADVVMNCVGPFFRFGVPVLEAAIEAGVDYIDICDDPEPTRDMHEMDEKAQAAGITAVVGLGASPGITSMLAARARAELDETDELIAAWNIEEDSGGDETLSYSAAIVHWMQQCSGTILECENGALINNRPLLDISLEYPGRGKRTVYSVGHPEPVSFHYSYPGLKRSYCVMVMPGMWIDEFRKLAKQIDSGKLSLEEAGRKLVENSGADSKNDQIAQFIDKVIGNIARMFDGPRLPLFFSLAKGTKNGKAVTVATHIKSIPPGMPQVTGIPLALGTLLHLRGEVKEKGVIAPEVAFKTDQFFKLLAPYCTFPARYDAEELVEVSVGHIVGAL